MDGPSRPRKESITWRVPDDGDGRRMFLIEASDASPDTMERPVVVCIVCGDYIGMGDLIGTITFLREGGDHDVVTPAMAWHVGRCALIVDKAALAFGAMMGDTHTAERLDQFRNDPTTPLRPGGRGLLRRRRKVLDLAATGRFLRQIASPLVRP
jgi:hypothetical protein